MLIFKKRTVAHKQSVAVQPPKESRDSKAVVAADAMKPHDPKKLLHALAKGIPYKALSRVNDFDRIIKLNPTCADAYSGRGACYLMQNQFLKAIDDFENAIRLGANHLDLIERVKCKAILMAIHFPHKVLLTLLSSSINQDSFASEVRRKFPTCSFLLLNHIDDLKDTQLRQAILVETQRKETLFGGLFDGLTRGPQNFSDNIDVFNRRAKVCLDHADIDGAIDYYNRVIQLITANDLSQGRESNPVCGEAYRERGKCYVLKRQFVNAIDDFHCAIKWSARELHLIEREKCKVILVSIYQPSAVPDQILNLLSRSTTSKEFVEGAAGLLDPSWLLDRIEHLHDRELQQTLLVDAQNQETFFGGLFVKKTQAVEKLLTDKASVLARRAEACFDVNDVEGSIYYYNLIIQSSFDPVTRAEAYSGRGECHLLRRHYVDAIDDFENAIRLGISDVDLVERAKCEALFISLLPRLQRNPSMVLRLLSYSANSEQFAEKAGRLIDAPRLLAEVNALDDIELQQTILLEAQDGKSYFGKLFVKHAQEMEKFPSRRVGVYIRRAQACFNCNDFDGAIGYYKMAIQVMSKPDAALYNNLAYSYYKNSQFNEAIENYIKAIRLKPHYQRACDSLKHVLLEQFENPSKNFFCYLLTLSQEEIFVEIINDLGDVDELLKKIKSLSDVELWQKVLLSAKNPTTFYGQLFARWPNKIDELLAVEVKFYFDKVEVCCQRQDFHGAIENCHLAMKFKFKPDGAFYNRLGNYNFRVAQYDDAIVNYNQAIALNFDVVNVRTARKQALSMGIKNPSDKLFQLLLQPSSCEMFVDIKDNLNALSTLLKYIRTLKDAKLKLKILIEAQKQETFFGKVFAMSANGLVELLAVEAKVYAHAGLDHYNKKNNFEAIKNYRLVIQLKPDHAKAHYMLGVLYYRQNQVDFAKECFAKALQVTSSSSKLKPEDRAAACRCRDALCSQKAERFSVSNNSSASTYQALGVRPALEDFKAAESDRVRQGCDGAPPAAATAVRQQLPEERRAFRIVG